MKHISTLFVSTFLFASVISHAQPGTLDGDFDADGLLVTGIENGNIEGRSVAIQSDEKIVVVGEYKKKSGFFDFALVRYNKDGSPDGNFGINGVVITDFGSNDLSCDVVLQPDGKIIVAGTSNAVTGLNKFALARYNQDGKLDSSFGTDGLVLGQLGEGRSVALQTDGKILVAGSDLSLLDFRVARYNSNGTFDNTFGIDGIVTTDFGGGKDGANSIAIQLDGKIVVAGTAQNDGNSDFAVVRYTSNGSLDNSFSIDGKVSTAIGPEVDRGESVIIQPDGKIIVAGSRSIHFTPSEFAIVRYHTDGTLDHSFSSDGKVVSDFFQGHNTGGRCAALQPDGKIIIVGQAGGSISEVYNFALLRYNTDGTLDDIFGSEGIVTTRIENESMAYSCSIQPNGRIVVAGYARSATGRNSLVVARYISGLNLGIISFSEQDHGLLAYPNPLQETATIEYTLTHDEIISIDLYDMSGRIMQSFVSSERRNEGTHKERLAIAPSISSGSYILTLSNGVGNSSVRVVK